MGSKVEAAKGRKPRRGWGVEWGGGKAAVTSDVEGRSLYLATRVPMPLKPQHPSGSAHLDPVPRVPPDALEGLTLQGAQKQGEAQQQQQQPR